MQDCTVLSNVMGSRNAPIKLVTELPEPNNPPPPPPPLESEVDDQPDLPVDPTYTGGDASNPYSYRSRVQAEEIVPEGQKANA
jgi:hypothetical protein